MLKNIFKVSRSNNITLSGIIYFLILFFFRQLKLKSENEIFLRQLFHQIHYFVLQKRYNLKFETSNSRISKLGICLANTSHGLPKNETKRWWETEIRKKSRPRNCIGTYNNKKRCASKYSKQSKGWRVMKK